ncbi:hypothetical protein QQF64_005815 [Cirrhinus molitorella]|uniref:Uncharacterized protein n=1 Tax=Cirrhinus molitorella TaxID=172907 RepID=A0ABR3MDF0_9TELE
MHNGLFQRERESNPNNSLTLCMSHPEHMLSLASLKGATPLHEKYRSSNSSSQSIQQERDVVLSRRVLGLCMSLLDVDRENLAWLAAFSLSTSTNTHATYQHLSSFSPTSFLSLSRSL